MRRVLLVPAACAMNRNRMKRPAPIDHRREPLPQERPKPGSEDPQAPAHLRAILDSPSYRRADRDLAFLGREDMRGLRLLLDYLKPQTLLREQNVAHTIVVFGGTRIPEPEAARRAVEAAATALDERPHDDGLRQRLGIAERVLAKSRYYDIAREFGRLVGHCGNIGDRRPHHGDDRRRSRDHGGGQSRRLRCRREIDRAQHHPAAGAIPEPVYHAGAVLHLSLLRDAQAAFRAAGAGAGCVSRRLRHARRIVRNSDTGPDP